jgi:multisubunit Na+/H+ antiporter MnhE subunit
MLHAAAMLAGLFLLSLLITARTGELNDVVLAAAIAVASLGVAALFGGVGRNPFASAPQFVVLIAQRASAQVAGALATMRAALAADVTLQPALVRVRTSVASSYAKAAMVGLASAAPGALVVDSDAEGVLVHVTNEESIGEEELGAIERQTAAWLGRAK